MLILYNTCIPHSPPVSTIWLTPSVSIVSYPFNWVVCHVVVHWFNSYVLFVSVILLCVCNGARTVVYTQLTGCSGYISCCTSVIGLPSLRCDATGRRRHMSTVSFPVLLCSRCWCLLSFILFACSNLALYMVQASYIALFHRICLFISCLFCCELILHMFCHFSIIVTTQVLSNFAFRSWKCARMFSPCIL